jgi:acyl carrier protein
MDALPVNAAGKPLRIGLTNRLDLKEMDDSLDMRARHYEARELDASQLETGMEKHKAPIPCRLVQVDANLSLAAIRAMAGVDNAAVRFRPSDGSLEAFVSVDAHDSNANDLDAKTIKAALAIQMHEYSVPEHVHLLSTPFPRKDSDGSIDFDAMLATIALSASSAMSVWDRAVRRIVANLLVMDEGQIGMDSDFFLLGGNSLLLGRLAYLIKKETGVALQISSLFTNSAIGAIAAMVEEEMSRMTVVDSPTAGPSRLGSTVTLNDLEASAAMDGKTLRNQDSIGSTASAYANLQPRRGQTHPLCLIVQAIPFIFFHPLRAALSWSVLLFVLAAMAKLASKNFEERIGSLLCAIAAGQLVSQLLSPLAAIAFKWLVIGRYRVGTYPFWSNYHLRWWIVNQALRSAGRGVFKYHPSLQVLYYRMLGAKIGEGVAFDHGVQRTWNFRLP